MPWQFLRHRTHAHSDVPLACLLCLAANSTHPTALIDTVTALALAADDTLHNRADPKVAEDVVSRLLVLTDAEAREILAAVPNAVRTGCGFTGRCDFHGVVQRFLSASRLGEVLVHELSAKLCPRCSPSVASRGRT